jgi:ergothioneine biosynthesis protein EgtB
MPTADDTPAATLARRFTAVRAATLALAAPLSEADCQVQSMADTSPTKWHLAHTTWFFETFVLERFERGFRPHHPAYRVLFNSYYNGVGEQHARPERGLITRPGLAEVLAYRRAVDERMLALLPGLQGAEAVALLELGLQHEQQHQELVLTDLLHMLSCNPLAPVYCTGAPAPDGAAAPMAWVAHEGGLVEIGHDGRGFAFDNEAPRHRRWLQPFALASRLVSNGEWEAFVADGGGYRDPRWWLAAGWDWVRARRVECPLYWRRGERGGWQEFTLHGQAPLQPQAPVTHLSLYEADAYARWAGAQLGRSLRLPTEAEWEHAAAGHAAAGIAAGNFAETGALHPRPAPPQPAGMPAEPTQLFGDAWEWTASDYAPYPGFRPAAGAVGEYNGKFMVNQYVLRGGSCATPRSHIRASYRNFFPAETRWQFTGLRLACEAA